MRTEQEIFNELAILCKSPGYIHAIAINCMMSHGVFLSEDLTAEDLPSSETNLTRNEIDTLIRLLLAGELNCQIPQSAKTQEYLDRTDSLMHELHVALFQASGEFIKGGSDLGKIMREPIYYSADSAYHFQYIDFASELYVKDNDWLIKNKGFSINDAIAVYKAIEAIQSELKESTFDQLKTKPYSKWTLLPSFVLDKSVVSSTSNISDKVVDKVFEAFTFYTPMEFNSISDLNDVSFKPIIQLKDCTFVLFQLYSLAEAIYTSPSYWMMADTRYKNSHLTNRGEFSEKFCSTRLGHIFKNSLVKSNVIIKSGKNDIAEIDTLVGCGDRAIIVQSKSKRLTIDSRKGDEEQIKRDFDMAVNAAYEQGLKCARALLDGNKLVDSDGYEIRAPVENLKEVYILCVLTDHYPSLTFQARLLLNRTESDIIQPPMVTDVFFLDVMIEMLHTPVRFLSYLNRRVRYSDQVFAPNEYSVLALHLRQNLWISDENEIIILPNDDTGDLDVAMMVRRMGVSGSRTPPGILTRLRDTTFGKVVEQIENSDDPACIELGLALLQVSENTIKEIDGGLVSLRNRGTETDEHDMSFHFEKIGGITIHVNSRDREGAYEHLLRHCTIRKYKQQANRWVGIVLDSADYQALKGVLVIEYSWEQNDGMDAIVCELGDGFHDLNQALKHARSSKWPRLWDAMKSWVLSQLKR